MDDFKVKNTKPSTHLVVSDESGGPGKLSSLSRTRSRRVQTVDFGVWQGKRLTVQRHAEHDFSAVRALFDPIVDGEVLREKYTVITSRLADRAFLSLTKLKYSMSSSGW